MNRIFAILIFTLTTLGGWAQFTTPSSGKDFLTKEQVGAHALPNKIAPIKAPFEMPQLKKPVFPAYSVNINDLGARPGEKSLK
ncbi:hypothetical protein [Euzebyella saccharophila]|uniref:Uncharacterized protein n=1 Tax=Euzebyella saccharophila TaxID=679664 RepID=A0ABV8JU73_9FLAO|nr:hypothetical protein [Euzebyella saccharophila]